MKSNVKVKNATKVESFGLKFDSKLEEMAYNVLLKFGVIPKREGLKAIIMDGFYPKVKYYTKDKTNYLINDSKKIKDWTYAPDFVFEYNDRLVILEMKGNKTDVWPYKCKMFRQYLEKQANKDNLVFAVIHTKAQLIELLNILKSEKMDKPTLSKRDFDLCLNKNSSKIFECFVFGDYRFVLECMTDEFEKLKNSIEEQNLNPWENERFVHFDNVLNILKTY